MNRPGTAEDRFQARATLYNAQAQALAQRVADSWPDKAPGTAQPDPETAIRMWNYSPSAAPEQEFWAIHDTVLQQHLANGESQTDATKAADTQAMMKVYPYRLQIMQSDVAGMDRQLEIANSMNALVQSRPVPPPHNPMATTFPDLEAAMTAASPNAPAAVPPPGETTVPQPADLTPIPLSPDGTQPMGGIPGGPNSQP